MMYCCRAGSILRSLSSGCENAIWTPDCRLGSKLLIGLLVVVRAVSHETLQVPAPLGSRCRTPVDENQSFVSTPRSPSRKFDGGVTLLERPKMVENTGVKAPLLSPTCAASTSVPSRTIADRDCFRQRGGPPPRA